MADLARDLRRAIRGEVRFDRGSRAAHATHASNYRQVPIGAIKGRSAESAPNSSGSNEWAPSMLQRQRRSPGWGSLPPPPRLGREWSAGIVIVAVLFLLAVFGFYFYVR